MGNMNEDIFQEHMFNYLQENMVMEKEELTRLKSEIRDRFGAFDDGVDLLFEIAELKLLAAERKIDQVEVRENKLMLSRGGSFVQLAGKFPRLTKRKPSARLKEIRRLVQSL